MALFMAVTAAHGQAIDEKKGWESILAASAAQWPGAELLNALEKGNTATDSRGLVWPESDGVGIAFGDPVQYGYLLSAYRRAWEPAHRYEVLRGLADLYFPMIEKKLVQHSVPASFKFLPIALTGLNPHYHDNRGRSGMWHLDYLTARSEQLRADSLVDERKGVEFTTEAAVRRLAALYKQYNGDEVKTFIAYMESPLYLAHRVDALGTIQWHRVDTHVVDALNRWTYAAAVFQRNPRPDRLAFFMEYFGGFKGVFFAHPVTTESLVACYGLDSVQLGSINPVYTGNRIDSSYRKVPLLLPVAAELSFRSDPDVLYRWNPPVPAPPAPTNIYRVRKGDSLGVIASRHGTSVAELKQLNHLRSDAIQPGQALQLPAGAVWSDSQTGTAAGEAQPPRRYTVKQGDSLWKIAQRYPGVTEENLKTWNRCSDHIRPGQVLLIYPVR